MNLDVWFYLSQDDEYDFSDTLVVSPDPTRLLTVSSAHTSRGVAVPNPTTTNADYHVIARVTGMTTAGTAVEDWIPLTGTVHVQPANYC